MMNRTLIALRLINKWAANKVDTDDSLDEAVYFYTPPDTHFAKNRRLVDSVLFESRLKNEFKQRCGEVWG